MPGRRALRDSAGAALPLAAARLSCLVPAQRAGEMLGTMLETSPPGGRWPSFRDSRSLVAGGLRVRGWVWLLSMLWVVAGATGTGYDFYLTTNRTPGLTSTSGSRGGAQILRRSDRRSSGDCRIVGSAYPTADCRVRQVSRLAAAQLAPHSWVGGGVDCGFALVYRAEVWGNTQRNSPAIGSPAMVSWGSWRSVPRGCCSGRC